jgi:hypothetical protein
MVVAMIGTMGLYWLAAGLVGLDFAADLFPETDVVQCRV